ncbi:MAG: cupin domain-containing protein [Chitinophagaceae bacterium]
MVQPKEYFLKDTGAFPNNKLPVLYYEQVLDIPTLFPAHSIKKLFTEHDWTNNWESGIYTYNHYHSNTHEAMGVIKGRTVLLLGGENGVRITLKKGDLLVIPAGVAHRNEGKEKDVICIGGYPEGKEYDMNYGKPEERPVVDKNIANTPLPLTGPLAGKEDALISIWKKYS